MARYWIVCLSAALVGSLTATAAWNFAYPDPFAGFVGVASLPFTFVGAMILLNIRRALYNRHFTSGLMAVATVLAGAFIGGLMLFIFSRLEAGALPVGAFYGFTTATALVVIVRLSHSTRPDSAKSGTS